MSILSLSNYLYGCVVRFDKEGKLCQSLPFQITYTDALRGLTKVGKCRIVRLTLANLASKICLQTELERIAKDTAGLPKIPPDCQWALGQFELRGKMKYNFRIIRLIHPQNPVGFRQKHIITILILGNVLSF